MTETIEVPDLEFEEGDYVKHWNEEAIARIDYIYCKYPSERWMYVIDYLDDDVVPRVERSRAEEDYSKKSPPRCPACGDHGEYSKYDSKWKCRNDCPVDTFDGELEWF